MGTTAEDTTAMIPNPNMISSNPNMISPNPDMISSSAIWPLRNIDSKSSKSHLVITYKRTVYTRNTKDRLIDQRGFGFCSFDTPPNYLHGHELSNLWRTPIQQHTIYVLGAHALGEKMGLSLWTGQHALGKVYAFVLMLVRMDMSHSHRSICIGLTWTVDEQKHAQNRLCHKSQERHLHLHFSRFHLVLVGQYMPPEHSNWWFGRSRWSGRSP